MRILTLPPPPHQYKLILWIIFMVFNSNILLAQNSLNVTPSGVLDKVFDRYGTGYELGNLQKPNISTFSSETTSTRFQLYYETESGMENSSNATHLARRQVLEKVLQDISTFIDLPVSTHKVNIWIRNLNNTSSNTNMVLSRGSSFYCVPKTTTGQITDAEVWKTIISGKSSYTNVVTAPNDYYHGFLAFNFATYNNTSVNWHTSLTTSPIAGSVDLYTVILKEVMHMLGHTSLINPLGNSVFGEEYKYYSRYDRFLRTASNVSLLTYTGGSTLLNYSFNNNLNPSILRPGCSLSNFINPNAADATTCADALRFRATGINVPLYTPSCYEIGNSLSCLEDQHYPSCNANNNNKYFVTSNKTNQQNLKRYPKTEERRILALIGYKLKNFYGTTSTLSGYFNYGTTTIAAPQTVIGVNDGINSDLTLTFTGNVGQNLSFSATKLLANDSNATTFEGLENITAPGSVNVTAGNASTTISINSAVKGIHLLRYIPKNAKGQIGNVTYFYVFLNKQNSCGTTLNCSYVVNGGFEQYNDLPFDTSQIDKACNWDNFNHGTVDYLHTNTINSIVGIPNNMFGNQTTTNVSNNAYAGYHIGTNGGEIFRTELASPLIAGETYTLSFAVSKAENFNHISSKIEAFISSNSFQQGMFNFLSPVTHLPFGLYFNSPTISNNTNDWETITFNFTASGGEKFLYLGALTPDHIVSHSTNFLQVAYYYIDNIVLIKTSNSSLANNDTISVNFDINTQTSTVSILANDVVNGNIITAPYTDITAVQVGNTIPAPAVGSITINSNGNIVVEANTSLGTYILDYKFISPCGESNVVRVTINIKDGFNIPHKFQYLHYPCFTPTTYNRSLYNLQDWNDGDFGLGILLNGVPISTANTTVSLAPGQTLINGITFNANGNVTLPNNAYGEFEFLVVFCSIQDPSVCTPPIRIYGWITDYFRTRSDVLEYSISANAFVASNPTNVLTNDLVDYCYLNPTSGVPAILNVNCTIQIIEASGPSILNIDPNTGNIIIGGSPTIGYHYYVRYRLCHPTIPSVCDYRYGSVLIKFVN